MADRQEFTYPSSDGVHQIHGVCWMPEGEPRAVVQLVHGISEFILRYDHFARFLTNHSFVVVGSDHLGHGLTAKGPKEYGCFPPSQGWTHVANDVHALRQQMSGRFPKLPYILMGHSMGSFVARTCLIRWPGEVDGCILSGTGQEATASVFFGKMMAGLVCRFRGPNTVSKTITKLSLGAYNRQFAPNRTGSDWISRDPAQVDAYMANPQCRFVPTVGMFRAMMEGLQFISNPENLNRMDPNTPIYLFSGDRDPVGASGAGVKKVHGFFKAAGTVDLTLKLYPDGRHEMLNEINQDEVYQDVLSWLNAHVSTAK